MGEGKMPDSKIIEPVDQKVLSRRSFIKVVGVFTLGASGAAVFGKAIPNASATEFPASAGYIVVDSARCQGCMTCMLACSLVHEGCANLSLSRIQVVQNSFVAWPDDITIHQCHHCLEADCVEACPTGALHVDTQNGNTRRVDNTKCVGCGLCVQACPAAVERPVLAPDSVFGGQLKSRKCDLCQSAPHHFSPNGGGYNGVQACVALCPLDAIRFTTTMPTQGGDEEYDFDFGNPEWFSFGCG